MKVPLPSKIHFNQVQPAAQKYKKEILSTISQVIDSGIFFNGLQVALLEKKLNSLMGRGYITTVSSGHDALFLALSSLNLVKDDEIIFPANAYPTAFPICLTKATPVPVDVDENGQLDPGELAKKITKKTRVVVIVHLYGLVGNLEEVMNITKKHHIFLIEDCAQAFGSLYIKKPVGTFGDISCFSFYPTKNIGTLGDGGCVWTKHKNLHQFFLRAKSYGEVKRYRSLFISGHSRIPEIQAGILNVYFKHLKDDFDKRTTLARYYTKRLKEKKLFNFIRILVSSPHSDPIPHLFVLEVDKRNHLSSHLARKGVETHIHYPFPVHLSHAFSFLNGKKGDFPNAEKLSNRILSIPFHSLLQKNQTDYIIKEIKSFYD